MEFLFAFIITKQSGISCVTILSKHFCIFLKRGKELKGEDVEASFKLECAENLIFENHYIVWMFMELKSLHC
jgi:hypothetical protein